MEWAFGEDYTASTLAGLGANTRAAIAVAKYGKPFDQLAPEQQYVATESMRSELQKIDLTQPNVAVSDGVAQAIAAAQTRIAGVLATEKLSAGWVPARSLSDDLAKQTADFIIYSVLTTVARRPGGAGSWTENWPYEPLVGNTPTTNTFLDQLLLHLLRLWRGSVSLPHRTSGAGGWSTSGSNSPSSSLPLRSAPIC